MSLLDKIDIKIKGISRGAEIATHVQFIRCKNLGTH